MRRAKQFLAVDQSPPPTVPLGEDERIKQFCQAASHELGNVLGTIVGELDYGLTNNNTLVRYRAMSVALAAADRAISLARNLSYFAMRKTLELSPVDISQLILDTVEMVERDLRGRHIQFQVLVETRCQITADPMACQQILLNLFRRSAETMPQGGRLTIRLQQQGQKVLILCEDTGVGIPQHRIESLEVRPSTLANTVDTSGLELAVARTLAERQGAEFTVRSNPNQGTQFRLQFPFDPQATLPKVFTELRRHRRVRASLPVEVAFNDKQAYTSEIHTLSVRGCSVALLESGQMKLPAIDTIGNLRIYYYQDQVLDIAKCRIANHSQTGDRTDIGIEFLEMDARAQKLLEAIVKSHSQ